MFHIPMYLAKQLFILELMFSRLKPPDSAKIIPLHLRALNRGGIQPPQFLKLSTFSQYNVSSLQCPLYEI